MDFTAVGSTSVAPPLTQWKVLGNALEILPGNYHFTDSTATNALIRFH